MQQFLSAGTQNRLIIRIEISASAAAQPLCACVDGTPLARVFLTIDAELVGGHVFDLLKRRERPLTMMPMPVTGATNHVTLRWPLSP